MVPRQQQLPPPSLQKQCITGTYIVRLSAATGLAREHNIMVRTAPGRYGTITHMAPETIKEGVLKAPCDVYAWGVLLWEMLTGQC